MRSLRRISQIIFFLFFLYLFLSATYPLENMLPPDLFLRASPLVALGAMLASRGFISLLIPALIIWLLTIPLGRFFCGWICPLGTIIDAGDRFLKAPKPRAKQRASVKFRSWKFFILIIVVGSALFSTQLIWLFDPIALLTRTFTAAIFPALAYLIDNSLTILMGISWLESPVYDLYSQLHARILPLEPHFFQNGILFFSLFLGILLLGRISPRFWCRNLCPLGALLGIFSKYRLTRRVVADSCTHCGRCQRECKMNAIEDDYSENSTIECIECLNCVAECPPDSISYKIGFPEKPAKVDLSKRQFVTATVAGVTTVAVLKTGYRNRNVNEKALRPPGALEEADFLNRCVRCHACTKICSTTGGCLQPALLESGWEGLLTPISVPRTGFCEYNCNLCGQVCPTGAIKNLPLPEKQKMKMGTASFDKSRCIPWYRLENCLVCEEHCPISEKAIQFEEKEVIHPNGEKTLVKFPYVVESRCVGCGICVTKCPLKGQAGIFVHNAGEMRTV